MTLEVSYAGWIILPAHPDQDREICIGVCYVHPSVTCGG